MLSIIGARLPRRSAQGLKVVVVAGNSEAALSLGRWTKTPHTLSEFGVGKLLSQGLTVAAFFTGANSHDLSHRDCCCILDKSKSTRS